ncbi:hypothetical protein L6452_21600 [Arctium lappa]|uniref:Uncharacterized protein n=1 Tax=Arctium lappa TaxID=4217 RepID=A0ACB9AXQ8_ARCLA|nr:hypothetical protein L6452_21600 [Arctium lappa]
MSPIAVGDTIPDGTLSYFDEEGHWRKINVHSLAVGKKVVLFGVLGAFTPSCSWLHVQGFIDKSEDLKSKGVEDILLISVNDAFAMKAWKMWFPVPNADNVKFLGDGSAKYTHALGMELDLSDRGLGVRSRRAIDILATL